MRVKTEEDPLGRCLEDQQKQTVPRAGVIGWREINLAVLFLVAKVHIHMMSSFSRASSVYVSVQLRKIQRSAHNVLLDTASIREFSQAMQGPVRQG